MASRSHLPIPHGLRLQLAESRLTRRPYSAVFTWIDEYAAEVVGRRGFDQLPPELAIPLLYEIALQRGPDSAGFQYYLQALKSGTMSNRDLYEHLKGGTEGLSKPRYRAETALLSLHESRTRFVRSLPRGSRIVDLGGVDMSDPRGGLVRFGYPYRFDSMVIVDLPSPDRHPTYQTDHLFKQIDYEVPTEKGPVTYRYHSMVDLSAFDDASIDLVYSGQSFEHVTAEEGRVVLKEVFRILRVGGYLALDTPNARLTRLQQSEFIDPDHKVEYTWPELSALLSDTGLSLERAHGLNYCGEGVRLGQFDMTEMAANCGLFDAVEDCYLMAAVARKC